MAAMFDERSTDAARASRNSRARSSGQVGPGVQHLDRDGAPEPRVLGAIDLAHAAGAERARRCGIARAAGPRARRASGRSCAVEAVPEGAAEFVEGLAHGLEADELPFAPALDQPRVGQDLQVVRHRRLGDVEGAADFTAAQLAAFARRCAGCPAGSRRRALWRCVRAADRPCGGISRRRRPRAGVAAKMFRYLS